MSKINDIENSLIKSNEAVFQTVCDSYLYYTEKEYPDLHRTGSQKGKQKVTKGTPDTYFKLENGRYVLIEYTTKNKADSKKKFIEKLTEDITKCLNPRITGIKINTIEKIIYCHNSSLSIKEAHPLYEFCEQRKVKLEIKDAHTIAFGIHARCPHISKELLGIEIEITEAKRLEKQLVDQNHEIETQKESSALA